MSEIYDISPSLTPELAVWPGDTSLSREVLLDMKNGDNLTLSTMRATVHLGAHADAPSHYGADAATIDDRNLDLYIGLCQVIHVSAARNSLVETSDLKSEIQAERVLIATDTFPDPTHWNNDFAALSPKLINYLHEQGVRLVGIDTPSVDPMESKELAAHKRFLAHDMAILEGLILRDVPDGMYELVALPLKLVGFDASPVRAILRTT